MKQDKSSSVFKKEEKVSSFEDTRSFGLNSLTLKIIACILMTLDHIALLFLTRGTGTIHTDYYVLRAIGKISFPLFVFLAVEGIYHTHNAKKYFLRLAVFALGLDAFGYIYGAIRGINVANNPLIGNAFTDMLMGVLMIYFLRKKNWYSLLALLPISYEVFSDFPVDTTYGTLFKSDWGTFSISLFFVLYLAREATDFFLKKKAIRDGLEEDAYKEKIRTYYNVAESIGLILIEAIFYLIFRYDYASFVLPNEFVPIGTYSTLAFVFYLLYNGKKGYSNKVLQYSFYFYYPVHLLILGIISTFVGTLASL